MKQSLLNTRQAAQYLGLSYYYLRNLRHDLSGPACSEGRSPRGKTFYYTEEALNTWNKTRKQKYINAHKCTYCKEIKDLSQFYNKQGRCKPCHNQAKKRNRATSTDFD